ncbi:hypothetical protein OAH77_04480 [Flavobacteriaceae bacterium]|nr:hypothetical protein [Flavobacteriaceae bacterium]
MGKRNSVYVIIDKNYTATVYSLDDLRQYVKRGELDPGYFTIHREETGNKELTKEIKKYIQDHIVIDARGVNRQVIFGLYANYTEEKSSVHFTAKEVAVMISNAYENLSPSYIKELEEKPNHEILTNLDKYGACYWTYTPDF